MSFINEVKSYLAFSRVEKTAALHQLQELIRVTCSSRQLSVIVSSSLIKSFAAQSDICSACDTINKRKYSGKSVNYNINNTNDEFETDT